MTSRVSQLAPGVELIALRTPTLPPATSTNTLVVGEERLVVIEPACPYPEDRRHGFYSNLLLTEQGHTCHCVPLLI